MNYKGHLKSGEEVTFQNDGEMTRVQLQTGDSSKLESQGTSFETGKWSKTPSLFATGEGAVLHIETADGAHFLAISKNAINRLNDAPKLENSGKIELQETDESPTSIDMKPMAPMKPMEPMKRLS